MVDNPTILVRVRAYIPGASFFGTTNFASLAPVLASMVEKIVDVPVAIMKPKASTVLDALDVVARRLGT